MSADQSATGPAIDEICALDALALSGLVHRRELSCVEVMRAYLARIDRVNPGFNAIVSLEPAERLLAQARAHDGLLERGEDLGWLHGLPIAVKDLSDAAGIRTTFGSPIFRDNVALADSLQVARMRAAGAIIIGKTNTPEFGLGSQTYNTVFGVTRNAYDPSLCAGGSSGGAAVALALRLLPVADGSDMGGSLRNPAAYANVYGFRPSAGRVPKFPAPERFIAQLGTEGPMARTVADLARLLATQAGFDPRVPLSLEQDPAVFADRLHDRIEPPRIGWLADLDGYLPMESGILDMCEGGLRVFESLGARVTRTALGFDPRALWDSWIRLRSVLVGGSINAHYADPARRAMLKPEACWEVENGLSTGALALYQASVTRTAWFDALSRLFEHHELLALPTAQAFAFPAELPWPTHVSGRRMETYHRWMEVAIYATMGGCPAISIPLGLDSAARPMGMQLIGAPRADLAVLQWARAYEGMRDWPRSQPPAAARP